MILVTGGTGFVGAHLLVALRKRGMQVRALKRITSDLSYVSDIFHYYGLKDRSFFDGIEWFDCDINDLFLMQEALKGITKVYHSAAEISFHGEDRQKMFHVNIQGTSNLVNLSLEAGVKKLCYVSSIASLGWPVADEMITEETYWKASRKNSNYGISKHNGEREVWRGIAEGLNAVIVNPSFILGPCQKGKGGCVFFEKIKKGLRFYPGGINGFVDVRDVAEIMITLMESDIINERFILNSENLKYQDLFGLIASIMDKRNPSIAVPPFLIEIAWRIMALFSFITGKPPLITRETARSATRVFRYSNEKILKNLDHRFYPVEESLKEMYRFFEWRSGQKIRPNK